LLEIHFIPIKPSFFQDPNSQNLPKISTIFPLIFYLEPLKEYVKGILTLLTLKGKVRMLSKDSNIPNLSTIVERTKQGFNKYAIRKRGLNNDYFIDTKFTLKAMSDFSVSMLAELSVRKSKNNSKAGS
jgi:hypothetical protein